MGGAARIGPLLGRTFVILFLLCAATALAEGLDYELEMSSWEVELGSSIELKVRVSGIPASDLDIVEIRPDRGLEYLASSSRTRVDPRTGLRSAEYNFGFMVLEAGKRRIEGILLAGRGGRIEIGPLIIDALPRSSTPQERAGPKPEPEAPPAWRWDFPPSVKLYECFELRLVQAEARPGARNTAGPAGSAEGLIPASKLEEAEGLFAVPSGLAIDASGPLRWTAIALDQGRILLPAARISSKGVEIGRAPLTFLEVAPLPRAVEESRAFGDFGLSLENIGLRAMAGEELSFRLVLAGRGNLPLVRLPKGSYRLGELRLESLSERRRDDFRPGRGAYEGRVILEIRLLPPEAGDLELSFEPLTIIDGAGAVRRLELGSATLRIMPSAPPAEAPPRSAEDTRAHETEVALRLARVYPELRDLPGFLEKAELDRAIAALSAESRDPVQRRILPLGSGPRDRVFLESRLRWSAGQKAEALALAYSLLRGWPRDRRAAESAEAWAGELGSGPPRLDRLPPPLPLAFGAILILGLGIASLVHSLRSGPSGLLFYALVLPALLVGLALASAAGLSTLERSRDFAVVWADSLPVVPSKEGRSRLSVVRGSTATISAAAPVEGEHYYRLVFAEGLSAWALRDSIFFY